MKTETTKLSAPTIVCGGCANAIKQALGAVAGVSEVAVETDTKIVTIEHDQRITREELIEELDQAGFPAA